MGPLGLRDRYLCFVRPYSRLKDLSDHFDAHQDLYARHDLPLSRIEADQGMKLRKLFGSKTYTGQMKLEGA